MMDIQGVLALQHSLHHPMFGYNRRQKQKLLTVHKQFTNIRIHPHHQF